MNWIVGRYRRIVTFLISDVWKLRLETYPPRKRLFLWLLRWILLSFRGFRGDYLKLRASALTYYTLMSIVPLLAMVFGIAKGFGYDASLEKMLMSNFKGQEEVLTWLIHFSHSLLYSVKGGLMALVGMAILSWSVVQVMNQVEGSFNDIWGVRKSRSFVRRFADYLAMMVVVPVIIVVASGANIFVITQLGSMSGLGRVVELVTPFFLLLTKILPYVLIWLAFTLMYLVMPHTRVKWQAALAAGILMGTAYQLLQWFYIDLQVGVSRYSAVYGSFAALPLLLLWMQAGWMIILFGAEMSYAYQNMALHEFEQEVARMSPYERRCLALFVFQSIALNFVDGKKPVTSRALSRQVHLPWSVTRAVLNDLTLCGLVSETSGRRAKTYQPGKDPHSLHVVQVMQALDRLGDNSLVKLNASRMQHIIDLQESFRTLLEHSRENISVRDWLKH